MLNAEQLLTLMRDKVDHPATAREVVQRLKIPREQRATVRRLLKDLVAAGHLIQTRGNRFGLPDRMNLVVGRVQTHPRGFGFVIPDRSVDGVSGDIFIAGSNLNQAMHGDRVVARIERTRDDRAEGRIVRILERGASSIVGRFDIDESGMIVAIGSEVQTVAALSTDRPGQLEAVQRLKAWGTTGLHDAIIASIDAIQSAKGRRALVLLSDGTDRYSQASATDTRDRARRSDVMVYPVALGKTRPPLFAELATLTGGRSFQPKNATEAMATMTMIAEELRQQYLLGYVPSKPIAPGEDHWRTITVRVRRPDVTVRARDGYVAK